MAKVAGFFPTDN